MIIGLQLYSIKEDVSQSFEGALRMASQAGYNGVEFAGYGGLSPKEMKNLLKKYELVPISSHVSLDALRDSLPAQLDYAEELGMKMLVCPWSSFENEETVRTTAAVLEAAAKEAQKRDIVLGYHNHAHEFVRFDGKLGMDLLLELAPSVKYQPDLYWIAYADVDPIAYIRPYQGRICAVHAKEMARDSKANVYVGQGRIDLKAAVSFLNPKKIPFIVEQEEFSGDRMEGIVQSCKGLKIALNQD